MGIELYKDYIIKNGLLMRKVADKTVIVLPSSIDNYEKDGCYRGGYVKELKVNKGKLAEKIVRMEKMIIGWGKERKKIEEKMERLGKRITELEKEGGKIEEIIKKKVEKGKEKRKVGEIEEEIWEKRMKRLEWEIKRKEKEERKSNIVITGLEMEEGGKGKTLQKLGKLLEDIGVVVKVERAKIIGRKNREERSVV